MMNEQATVTATPTSRAPRITVLRCDDVPEPDRSVHGDTEVRTARHILRAAQVLGWTPIVDVGDVYAGERPGFDSDLFVTTGSATSPLSDAPWVQGLRDWLLEALPRGARVYGICFGHQLIAQVLGGVVGRAPGWEVGCVAMRRDLRLGVGTATELGDTADAKRDSLPAEVRLLQSHQDEVQGLAPGARLWLRGAQCAIQGYVHEVGDAGGRVAAVQGHPEFERDQVRDLYTRRRERLGEALFTAAWASTDIDHHGLALSVEAMTWLIGDRFATGIPASPIAARPNATGIDAV